MFIRYEGPWVDAAIRRHMVSAHRRDTDDLTVAHILPDSEDSPLRPGEVEITEDEFNVTVAAINTHNRDIVEQNPPPNVDPMSALLSALANEWEVSARELRANRPTGAADALARAAQVARQAAQ